MSDVADVRQRLQRMIEQARQEAAERRRRAEEDAGTAERFLESVATPVMQQVARVLCVEGFEFRLSTPAGSVRLVSERRKEDYVDLSIDATADPVTILTEVAHARGRRVSTVERPLAPDVPLGQLTDEHVLAFLLDALKGFVAR